MTWLTRSWIVLTLALAVGAAAGQSAAPDAGSDAEAAEDVVYVLMPTSKGDIVLALRRGRAPITVKNFLSYADKDFYEDTIFHRVIPGFMIQGGGLTSDLEKKPTDAPIKNEWDNGLKNERGTIAMARTGQPDSATSQFFINVADNLPLSQARPRTGGAGYAVFGKVVAGMDVVDEIAAAETGMKKGRRNVPIEAVVIKDVRKLSAEEAQKLTGSGEESSGSGGPTQG